MTLTTPREGDGPRTRARAAWSLADQVIVSARNFAVLLIVIRETDASTAGAFGLVYATYFLLMAMVRGIAGDPLLIRFSGASDADLRTPATRSLTTAFLSSAACGVVLVAGLAISRQEVWIGLAVLGSCLPFLLAHDHLRLVMFAAGRADRACRNDALVTSGVLVTVVALAVAGTVTISAVLVAWTAVSLVGIAMALFQTSLKPGVRGLRSWWRAHRDLGPRFALDAAANRGTEQLANVCIAGLGGLGMVGAITASRLLFAPLTTIQTGINTWLLPELARRNRVGERRGMGGFVARVAGALGLAMVVTGLALALVPERWGVALLSGNWTLAREVLLPMTVFSALNAIAFAYWAALKALAGARETLRVRTVGGLVGAGAAALGAARDASMATWGMALGALVTAAWLAREFAAKVREEGV